MPPAASRSASDAVVGLYDVPPIWGHVLDYLPYDMMDAALSAVHEDVQEEVELAITTLNLTERPNSSTHRRPAAAGQRRGDQLPVLSMLHTHGHTAHIMTAVWL